jgi:hypothetical protein
MAANYTSNRDWIDALILTYQAKKRAEIAPGVGYTTDFYYILPDTTLYFEPVHMLQGSLERVYLERRAKELNALDEDRQRLVTLLDQNNATPSGSKEDEDGTAPVEASDTSTGGVIA